MADDGIQREVLPIPISDRKIRAVEHRLPGPPWAPGPGRNQDIATLFLSIAVATTLAGAPRRAASSPRPPEGTAGPVGGGPSPEGPRSVWNGQLAIDHRTTPTPRPTGLSRPKT